MIAKSKIVKTGLVNTREEMNNLLLQCNEAQQNLFHRMYPNGPSDEQLDQACSQIERTLEKQKES